MTSTTAPGPPEGYVPVRVPSLRHAMALELQGTLSVAIAADECIYYAGPRRRLPGLPAVETVWTDHHRLLARRVDNAVIITPIQLRGTLRALHDAAVAFIAARGAQAAPEAWEPRRRTELPGLPSSSVEFWRGPTFLSPEDVLPALQLRWTPADGVVIARTDNGGHLTLEDLRGSLGALGTVLDELREPTE